MKSSEQNVGLLNKSAILFLMIPLDLEKSSEVRKAGDRMITVHTAVL